MNERMKRWAWPLGLAVTAGLARWASLGLLLDRDEGEFASLAWLWRSGHGLPYRDYLEQKPPLSLLPHALAQALAPLDAVGALRWISLLWVLATVLGLYAFVRALARRGQLGQGLQRQGARAETVAGLAGLAAALLFSSVGTQSLAANTETWQTLPLLGALALAFLDPEPGPWRWLTAGFLLGLASLFKQPVLAGVLLLPWAARSRALVKAVALMGAGLSLAWALAWAPFAFQGGGLAFLNCTLAYNEGYVVSGQSQAWARAAGLAWHLAPELGLAALLAVGGAWRLWRERGRFGWLAAWGGLGLIALAASGRYYPHYAILLMGPLAVLVGLGVDALWQAAASSRQRWGALLAVAAATLAWGWVQWPLWRAAEPPQRTWELYHVPSFCTAPQAALRIQAACPEGRRLFLWGDDAEIFYLSRRAPTTRFLFTYPFTGEAPAWPSGDQELKAALLDPSTGAAAIVRALDAQKPLQFDLLHGLQDGFKEEDGVPGWILGSRR